MSAGAPLSARRLDEIASRAADLCEYSVSHGAEVDALAGEDVPALLGEVFRLRAERDRQRAEFDKAVAAFNTVALENTELRARPSRAERLREWHDPASGACTECGELPDAWCQACAGCACPGGRPATHAAGGTCPTVAAAEGGDPS